MERMAQVIKQRFGYVVINSKGKTILDTESKAEAERACEYENELNNFLAVI